MSISAIERLTLGKQLAGLMQEQKTASAIQRISIGQQIINVMLKLGLGTAAQPEPEPEPEPQPTPPVNEETPKIVSDFLRGAFNKASQMEFIDTLRAIAGYVGQFLTLDQAKEQTANWVSSNGYAE